MTTASGILFKTKSNQALFLKRGPTARDYPGHWDFPGGGAEPEDKDLEATAIREANEEIGKFPKAALTVLTRSIAAQPPTTAAVTDDGLASPDEPSSVDFTTFLASIDEPFQITLGDEHVAFTWCPVNDPPQPIHPGCAVALARLTMHELDVAKAIADGRLTSPQVYENVTLFAIRITGTGAAYRRALDEYVWRDPELYLNDDFLQRCNGLPVIFEHPKNALLTSKEFNDRSVGTILLPYINGNEVWGIAKIYDAAAIKMMSESQLSTSPAVTWRDLSVNTVLKQDDGSSLLIEGQPSLLDHIAICDQGVWDKGGDPVGVRMDANSSMHTATADVFNFTPRFPSAKIDLALAKTRNLALDGALRSFR